MQQLQVSVPGGRLFVVDEGDGPPILLLHASLVDSRAWEPVVPHLVAAGYRAIRFDARGFGRSDTEDVEFSNRADVVAVLDALGVDRACLVGNSRGGQIAVDTAVEFPGRVAALVTIAASVGGYEPEPTPAEAALFEEMDRLDAGADPEAVADFDVRLWVDGIGQPADRVPSAVREAVREMDRAVADRDRVHGRPIRLLPPAAERLDALMMPVLAIAGALDVSDVWATAQHLERTCRDARAILMQDVAHMIALEAPQAIAGLIVELLQPLGRFG
jgi:3-oxoadipate enol-lactonase